MAQTAITYPGVAVRTMTGAELKEALEDIADNLFNPDPYYQQGGDMVRTGGLSYACNPHAAIGQRISDMRLKGKRLDADKSYRVAGWAAVTQSEMTGPPVWEPVRAYLEDASVVRVDSINTPHLL